MDEIHMGKKVREVTIKRGMRPPDLAKQMGIHKQGMHHIWKRKEFHTKTLKKLCRILDYDFFQHLAKVDMAQMEELQKKNAALENEIALLKRENQLLVQANNWLSKR